MRTRSVLSVVVLICIFLLACAPALIAGETASAPGVSLIPINPDAAAALKAQGRSFKYPFPNKVNNGNKFSPGGQAIGPLNTAATQKIIVLFVSFSDNPTGGPNTRVNLTTFDDLLFGTTYDTTYWQQLKNTYGINYPTDRTLRNYYNEVSYGKVLVTTNNKPSDTNWIDVGHPYNYYFGDHNNGFSLDPPQGVWGLVIDALNGAKEKVDFSPYANPTTHVVPNVFVVVAGTGAEWSGTPDLMWSHSSYINWYTGGAGLNVGTDADPVYVNHYAMMPEVGGDLTGFAGPKYGPYPPTVGVFAHEYGHVLGLPDQYDYGYESEGTGQYTLMAGGSWGTYPLYLNFYGNSPSHMDAWSKYRLGFVTPVNLSSGTGTQHVTLRPAERYPDIYRMDVPNSGGKEYYLFENRQQIGFDQGLWPTGGAHGLAIYHVDDVALSTNYSRPNEAENWKEFRSEGAQKASNGLRHYGISLIQADDQWSLEHGFNQGDAGDLFPGLYNLTSFGNYTFPNSSSYYFWGGSTPKFGYSGVNVFNIVESGTSIEADFSYQPWVPSGR